MFGSHRRARASALFAVVLSVVGSSCARGSQSVDGSPFGLVSPVASSRSDAPDAAIPSTYDTSDPDAAGAPVAVAAGNDADDDAEVGAGEDATDTYPDDAGDEPATVDAPAAAPAPGDLAITEIMLSPSGPQPQSEWFEIYNLASSPRLLSGLTIEDGYGDIAVIGSAPAALVPPASYALLVRDKRGAERTLLRATSIAYAYGEGLAPGDGIELDGGAAGDLSIWNGGTLLAEVPYGLWDSSWIGQSIELATPQSDESDPAQWCVAQSPWASGSDDGTPGAPSDCGP